MNDETTPPEPPQPVSFRKRPVAIMAMLFATVADGSFIAEWCGGSNDKSPEEIQITTLEGVMTASLGDYIIQGIKGEFYPCKPDIFLGSYELELPETTDELENPVLQSGEDIAVLDDPSIVATLWLPLVKPGRNVPILGRSGKRYLFTPDKDRERALTLNFTSAEAFEAAHVDISRSSRNRVVVSILLGDPNPAHRAREAVQIFIGSPLKINAGYRLKVLKEIQILVNDEVARLSNQGTESGTLPPEPGQATFIPEPPPEKELEAVDESGSRDSAHDFGTEPDPFSAEPEKTELRPADKHTYTAEEMETMPMDELKELAKKFNTRAQTRDGIIGAILGKQ